MKPLKVYILEDEIVTQEILKQTLESLNYFVCGMQTHAEKALTEINKLSPDVAILDIRVEGEKTGLWLGKQLNIPIIYLTAFSDSNSVKEAMGSNPVSYLQKPFNDKDLFIALEMVKQKLKSQKQIFVKENNYTIKIVVDSILYAKKEDHYLHIYTQNGVKMIRSTVKEFLQKVNKNFIQVHRSYIVNINHVEGFSSKKVQVNNTEIPLSSTYYNQLKESIL